MERLPLVQEQEQPEPPSAPGQEPAVLAGRQWFERVRHRHGIELRKPFR